MAPKRITEACTFKYIYDGKVAPTILDGGSELLLANYHGPRSLKCDTKYGPIFILHQVNCITQWQLAGPNDQDSSISQSDVGTSSSKGGGMHLNCSLKGSSSLRQISCSMPLVQPSSL